MCNTAFLTMLLVPEPRCDATQLTDLPPDLLCTIASFIPDAVGVTSLLQCSKQLSSLDGPYLRAQWLLRQKNDAPLLLLAAERGKLPV